MNPTVRGRPGRRPRGVDRAAAHLHQRPGPVGYLFPTAALLVVMFFMRDATVPGTDFSLGARTLPSALGMGIAFGGLVGLAQQLVVEREDGTLLRAKATPNGMLGYLVGKIIADRRRWSLISLVLQLVPALFFLDGLAVTTRVRLVHPGLGAGARPGRDPADRRGPRLAVREPAQPRPGHAADHGADRDSPASSTRSPASRAGCSGVAQVFPIYWLGLGMRSALLPDGMAAVELGRSWRHLETLGVLGAWAVLGLVLAPVVLRRMARRESGSRVAARRERAMQRVG